MDKLPQLFNIIEVTLHRDEFGRTLLRNGKKPTDLQVAKYTFITENPGYHPVQLHKIDELTEERLDHYTCAAFDTEHFATDYQFTDEESDDLARLPETLILGSGLVIPQQSIYLRAPHPFEERSDIVCVQRKSIVYFCKDKLELSDILKQTKND